MSGPYDDIIELPHHVSPTRPRMTVAERAAQFSPFAALSGYEAAINETARRTDERIELDEQAQAELDMKLRLLAAALPQRPQAQITWFLPDGKKAGGAYVSVSGQIKNIDSQRRVVIMSDGARIPIKDIIAVENGR